MYVCAHMCVSTLTYVQVLTEARIGHQMPWSWSFKTCKVPNVGAENGTLQEHQVLLAPSSPFTSVPFRCSLLRDRRGRFGGEKRRVDCNMLIVVCRS